MMRDVASEFFPAATQESVPNLADVLTALQQWHDTESNPQPVEAEDLDAPHP